MPTPDDKMDIDTTPEISTHYPPLFRTLSGMPQNILYSTIIQSFLRQARDNSDVNKIQKFFNELAKLIGAPKNLSIQPDKEKIYLFAMLAKKHLEDLCVPLLKHFSNNGPIHPKNKEFLDQYIKHIAPAPMEVENFSTPMP